MQKICILLSIYNGKNFLKKQLASLLYQTYKNTEIFVRDDGSVDDSSKILSSNKFIILKNSNNVGIKKSFEILLDYCVKNTTLEYFMFSDQDDVWNSEKVEKTYLKMQELENIYGKDMPLLVHSDLTVVDKELNIIARSFWKYQNIDPSKDSLNRLILHNVVTGCTMMINRALAEKIKTIPDEAIMHDWWIAMMASSFGKIVYIDEPLMFYRQHGKNDTGAKKYNFRYVWKTLLTKLLSGQYQSKLHKYINQSKAFLALYGKELNENDRKMLEEFSAFEKLHKYQKLKVLFKYKIWKNGFMRNLGLIFFA